MNNLKNFETTQTKNNLTFNTKTVLIVNDDGFKSKSFESIIISLKNIEQTNKNTRFNILICTPNKNRSGAGASITLYKTIKTKLKSFKYNNEKILSLVVNGTPVDCVKIGVSFLKETFNVKPDLILSGVNPGENIGQNIYYSGTVMSCFEAKQHSIPSVAFSKELNTTESTEKFIINFIEELIKESMKTNFKEFINPVSINFPSNITQTSKILKSRKGKKEYSKLVRNKKFNNIIFYKEILNIKQSTNKNEDTTNLKNENVTLTHLIF